MSELTRVALLEQQTDLSEKGVALCARINKRESMRTLLDLEDLVDIAEIHYEHAKNSPGPFDLAAVVDAEIDFENAKNDLERAKRIHEQLFPSESKEETLETIHDTDKS